MALDPDQIDEEEESHAAWWRVRQLRKGAEVASPEPGKRPRFQRWRPPAEVHLDMVLVAQKMRNRGQEGPEEY